MSLARDIKRRLRDVAIPTVGALVVTYFVYHAVQGDRGILAWLTVNQQIRQAETLRTQVADERHRLEARVASLRSDHLDPDMLDERARAVLGLVRPEDVIVFDQPAVTSGPPKR